MNKLFTNLDSFISNRINESKSFKLNKKEEKLANLVIDSVKEFNTLIEY